MSDLRLQIQDDGFADLVIEDGDLSLDRGLMTWVIVSLFTDGRAPAGEEIPDGTNDPRGWWGESPLDPTGSLLWLLSRSKLTQTTLERARNYTAAALAWMEEALIVDAIEVETARIQNVLVITIRMAQGADPDRRIEWEETRQEVLELSDDLRVRVLYGTS